LEEGKTGKALNAETLSPEGSGAEKRSEEARNGKITGLRYS
jgi:hypothetical protein